MNTTFQDLGLSKATLSAVKRLGFTAPTPVQEQAIPLALAGRDVVAAAKTGTGKTAAFALPTIERIGRLGIERSNTGHSSAKHSDAQHTDSQRADAQRSDTKRSGNKRSEQSGSQRAGTPRALIVSPTRELAQQIDQACFSFCKNTRLRVLTVVGGISYNTQISKLKRGVDILVATPGRLFDLMERGVVHLGEVEVLVLDEADRMLDMGFWPTMKKIVAATPSTRQTLLFSATIDRRIMQNIEPILNNPAFVEISHSGEKADTVDHFVVRTEQAKKSELLCAILKDKGADRSIVFTRTKSRSDSCARKLQAAGFQVEAIHSNKSQSQRKRALENFSKGRTGILVATDVLARGIDVSQVEQVINYDLPDCPEDYIHRIGRTGRAGEAGYAISFVSPETKGQLRDIEKLLGEKIPPLSFERQNNSEVEADAGLEKRPAPSNHNGGSKRNAPSPQREGRPSRNRRGKNKSFAKSKQGQRTQAGAKKAMPFSS